MWRRDAGSHEISILGATLAYPAANADAIVILALAVVGFAVIGIAVAAAAHEITGAVHLSRRLKTARPLERNRRAGHRGRGPASVLRGAVSSTHVRIERGPQSPRRRGTRRGSRT